MKVERTGSEPILECVVNISLGRRNDQIDALAATVADDLLDVHRDPHHNRSVFTLIGEAAPRTLSSAAIELLDISDHVGVHPRIGVVDVVPFVPLQNATMTDAEHARDRFAAWAAATLNLPCFTYGSHRTLPAIRRHAFGDLAPDFGPDHPHPTAGACAVGARPLLVAYNVWVSPAPIATIRQIATDVRAPDLRTLGLEVGDRFQVSCNLINPRLIGPAEAYDRIAKAASAYGVRAVGAELVGLVPESVCTATDPARWGELDLAADRTIEARLRARAQRNAG